MLILWETAFRSSLPPLLKHCIFYLCIRKADRQQDTHTFPHAGSVPKWPQQLELGDKYLNQHPLLPRHLGRKLSWMQSGWDLNQVLWYMNRTRRSLTRCTTLLSLISFSIMFTVTSFYTGYEKKGGKRIISLFLILQLLSPFIIFLLILHLPLLTG